MSISNLLNQNNLDIYCNTINASFATLPVIETTNLVTQGIQIQPLPPVNNTLNNLLAFDSVGDVVIRQADSIGNAVNPSVINDIPIFSNTTGQLADSGLSVNNVVNLTSAQTLTNKTLTSALINTSTITGGFYRTSAGTQSVVFNTAPLTATRTMSFPDISDVIVGVNATQVLSNKSIDSAINTISVNGTNINSRINQDVRTTASPTFVGANFSANTTWTFANASGQSRLILDQQDGSNSGTEYSINRSGTLYSGFGYNSSTNETYLYAYAGTPSNPLKIGTNYTERLRILSTGIPLDTTVTNILGLNGTTLSYRNDIVTLSGSQSLSNKTINGLFSLGTTATLLSGKDTLYYTSGITTVGNVTTTFASFSPASGTVLTVKCFVMAFCTASSGGDLNKTRIFEATFAGKNLSGTITTYTILNNNASDAAFAPTLSVTSSGSSLIIQVTGVTNDTISYSGELIALQQ